jgi:ABC-2 type transport system ATP-binding protein
MEATPTKIIRATNLVKRFGDFTAVGGIDFSVHRGEIFGFLGPNGSGKTTTIRMMIGLLKPTEGDVDVLGIPVHVSPEKLRPRIGYMSQRFSLYNDLTVMENLRFYGRAYGLANSRLEERVQEALRMADLVGRESVRTSELAGGWRQRLALGASILHQPELIFLDEPTAGVDPVSRRDFWELLYQLAAEGTTIFVTTHYMDEAEHCHRLAFIQHGRLIARGTVDEIRRGTMRGQVIEINPGDPTVVMEALQDIQGQGHFPIDEISLYGSRLHVLTRDAAKHQPQIVRALKDRGLDPGEVEVIEPSLEDVFIANMRQAEVEFNSDGDRDEESL